MLKAFQALKSILISAALAAGCSVGGVHGIYHRVTYEAPTPTTCADLDMSKQGGWIVVEGCEALLWDAVLEETKRGTVTAVSVPLRPKGSSEKPRIVLTTSNDEVLSVVRAINENADGIDPGRHTPDEIQQNRAKLLQAFRPVAVPRFQAHVEGRPVGKLSELMPHLTSNTIVVRQVEEGKPGFLWPLFMLLLGAFWGLSAVSSVRSLVSPDPEPDDAVA